MKTAYWARFFKQADGRYTVDVPDLPGCLTQGVSVEEAHLRLVAEAIPLWLEDQPWPPARSADEVLAFPRPLDGPQPLLVRVAIDDVGGPGAWPFWARPSGNAKHRPVGH